MSDTTLAGGPYQESPFHRGERAVQDRVGVRDQMEARGRIAIRNAMPEQHREFFPQLPFVIVGSVDSGGQPWASVLAAEPGFITSPNPQRLVIRARILFADPLHDTLHADAAIGLLGIEPHTRRRNRMNGIVEQLDTDGFSLRVVQSFGNCPKYIQARKPIFASDTSNGQARQVHRAIGLDGAMRRLVGAADTLFIATSAAADSKSESDGRTTFVDDGDACVGQDGVDVSHRGGKPGLVRIDDDSTLTMPDFVGNFFFNTLGNLVVNPRAGLLFIDFANGDLLYLAVDVEIIWDGAEVRAFEGAQRLLRFHIKQALRVEASLPLRWGAAELSPVLTSTGSWEDAARYVTDLPPSAQGSAKLA